MKRAARRCVPAMCVVLTWMVPSRSAFAEAHRVAAVDPDTELARALDVALSPWGAALTEVHLNQPGATVTLSLEKARTIASETHADVVVWVSVSEDRAAENHYAVWIYDVASDRASLRDLTSSPPFNATTAAAVALSVKALLRFTVVAPPPERFGAAPKQPTWEFGLSTSVALHFGQMHAMNGDQLSPEVEARYAAYAAYWPAWLGHRWGASLSVSTGPGVHVHNVPFNVGGDPANPAAFSGTLIDYGFRAAVGGRFALRPLMNLDLSVGAAGHLLQLTGTISATKDTVSGHFAYGVEPQAALDLSLFNGFVHFAPWIGATVLANPHRFSPVNPADGTVMGDVTLIDEARFTSEGGIRVEFVVQ
jgi:hypothetical protein